MTQDTASTLHTNRRHAMFAAIALLWAGCCGDGCEEDVQWIEVCGGGGQCVTNSSDSCSTDSELSAFSNLCQSYGFDQKDPARKLCDHNLTLFKERKQLDAGWTVKCTSGRRVKNPLNHQRP
jgi:hypothetical protein